MHEFSISSEIARSVLETAEKHGGKKVLSIQLDIGEVTLLNAEQVAFWIEELLKGSIAEGAEIRVKTIKARIACGGCGYKGRVKSGERNLVSHFLPVLCPRCGSFQVEIKKGRECLLRRIQVEK